MKRGNKEPEEHQSPEDLCRAAFSRCSNWPSDRLGQLGLAQGLKVASERYKLTQEAIVTECRQSSAFCPTDADILRVASQMAAARERREPAVAPWLTLPECALCNGTGWQPGKGIARAGVFAGTVYDTVKRCPNGCQIPDQNRFGGNI